ncbi:MAG: SMI1/KNR4 family protein [Coriobacteriales bacterium]|nr:SMI1/KNR4 family protein [Coriobacteriales bacterium]
MNRDLQKKIKPFFDRIESDDFWDDCDYALEEYVGAPATDEMFAQTEKALGYRLPESYKQMMRRHNGGLVRYGLFPRPFFAYNEPDEIHISGIMGVDPSKPYSLCGEFGCRSIIQKWRYPALGIGVCSCPSAGHDLVFLDYRHCGPEGEPEVIHIDQESDYAVTYLAPNFEDFILGLEKEDGDE